MIQRSIIALAAAALVSVAMGQSFSNPSSIPIPPSGTGGTLDGNSTASSQIVVSGVGTTLTGITVDFFSSTTAGLSHTFPDDIDVMLVAPDGSRTILMSDCGGSLDVVSVLLSFDDAAANSLPDATQISSGTFKPTNIGAGDTWYRPDNTLETAATTATLSTFLGSDPNGTWTLWVRDDLGGDVGSLASGWRINLTAVPEPGTLAVLAIGALGMLARRRRK